MTRSILRLPAPLQMILIGTATLLLLVTSAFTLGSTPAQPTGTPFYAAQAETTPSAAPVITATATPVNPIDLLDVLSLANVGSGSVVVKQDPLDLDGNSVPEILLTLSVPVTVTEGGITTTLSTDEYTDHSGLSLLRFDEAAQEWTVAWQTDEGITGHAAPLPSPPSAADAASSLLNAWQGKHLLRDDRPVFMLRTYGTPATGSSAPTVQLRLYAWNGTTAEALKVAGATGDDQVITGTNDVSPADIDHDGIYEVIADSGANTTIWRWDGTQFVGGSK